MLRRPKGEGPMSLPQPMLASYWIPYVGISNNPMQKVVVPLTDILNYVLADGTPQTKIVFLGAANFSCTPTNFQPPYVSINAGILEQLTLQPGQTQTAVQQLQAAGIKVLLSIMGPNNGIMGWENVPYAAGADPYANMTAFAKWVKTDLIDAYGLDGIDIDDEFGGPANAQAFMDTVAILRHYLGGALLTKALWNDYQVFHTAVSKTAPCHGGAMLSSLLDLGCTMDYGSGAQGQEATIANYVSWGMTADQLCVGVQAGPWQLGWMTTLADTSTLATWAVTPANGATPVLGMMLYTFTQDIQQWDEYPQNAPQYTFPNPGDHAWQKAIVVGMWGAANWIVT
jgi:Glycosyl hydrolases family 18